MKRIFLILACTGLLNFSGGSQGITLTYLNSGYIPGNSFTTFNADTTGILPGNAGPGMYWDFSTLNVKNTPNIVNYVDPKTTLYSSSFSSATVAYSSGTSFYYYKINSTEYSFIGDADPDFKSVYSDPQIFLTYPFKYGDEINDPFVSHTTGQMESFMTGTTHIKADAWGTIKLPHNTYNNVLRVKYDIVSKDSNGDVGVAKSQTQTYLWYDGTHKTPILEITAIQDFINDVPYNSIKNVIVADFTNGITKNFIKHSDFTLYPNPANHNTDISYDLNNESEVNIAIYTIYGELIRVVKSGKESSGHHIENIPLTGFQPGIYFLQLKRNNSIMTQKLIIE